MASRTLLRLNKQVHEKVAHIVLHELKDPRVGFVTITRAELTPDYSLCRVYYSVIGTPGDKSKTAHALESARGYIQSRVGDTLRTRVLPILQFHYDDSVEGVLEVGKLIRELKEEREGRLPSAAAGEGTADEGPTSTPVEESGSSDPEPEEG